MAKAKIDMVAQPNDVSDLKFGVHVGLCQDEDGISTRDYSHRRLPAPRSGSGCEIREAKPSVSAKRENIQVSFVFIISLFYLFNKVLLNNVC